MQKDVPILNRAKSIKIIMKGIERITVFIVVAIIAIAVLAMAMMYGIIPIGGEVAKWNCQRRMIEACNKWARAGDMEVSNIWAQCGKKYFGEVYLSWEEFCAAQQIEKS
jgi:hypothetical protein